jgi:DNA-binding CsgD family transcriptional regulator
MKDHQQKSVGEPAQGYELPPVLPCGEGPRAVAEYLFAALPFDDRSSDEQIAAPSDEEENEIAGMVHFFLQARYEEAAAAAERCLISRHPEVRTFALLAHAVSSIAQHNIELALKDFQSLQQEAQFPENRRVAALHDVYHFLLSVFFQLGEQNALPLEIFPDCSEGIRLYALYAQSHALYLQQDYAQALGVAKAALAMAADRHQIVCIYLNLAACMAAMSLSCFEQADHFFLSALRIAKPEKYIQPFVGHHGPLQGLVEKHIRDQEPEVYKLIAEKVIRFRRGWTEIHNPQSDDKVTNLLTPYEFSLAMMAAKGKTNREIAEYFHISVNTVKTHLSTIFRKLGITKRIDLQQFLSK